MDKITLEEKDIIFWAVNKIIGEDNVDYVDIKEDNSIDIQTCGESECGEEGSVEYDVQGNSYKGEGDVDQVAGTIKDILNKLESQIVSKIKVIKLNQWFD